jgi:AmmeMemoRadiSam system protein B
MDFVREPAVSGMFYPDNPGVLRKDIDMYLEVAIVPDLDGDNIIGIISPHAGYLYSGPVAAYGYKTIAGKEYDTVIVIAPSHKAYFDGVALWDRGGFKTPLGAINVDEEIARAMVDLGGVIQPNREAHRQEHALEVQLPFLQVVLNQFSIIPLIMGTQTTDMCNELAQTIYEVVHKSKKKFLIVCSTDLSHYYSYEKAVKLDKGLVEQIDGFNVSGVIDIIKQGKAEACGAGPLIVTMLLSEKLGADHSRVLKYANSGDVSGDRSRVVGYVSAALYRHHPGEGGSQ